jgi:hypothetical protein
LAKTPCKSRLFNRRRAAFFWRFALVDGCIAFSQIDVQNTPLVLFVHHHAGFFKGVDERRFNARLFHRLDGQVLDYLKRRCSFKDSFGLMAIGTDEGSPKALNCLSRFIGKVNHPEDLPIVRFHPINVLLDAAMLVLLATAAGADRIATKLLHGYSRWEWRSH